MAGFAHDIAGGSGDLVITSVQSPDYVAGVSGWQIRKDGSAEFNSLVIRGTFNGTDFVIGPAGEFFYSGTPALGNLILSVARAAGTDAEGNAYLAGTVSYLPGSQYSASAMAGGALSFYTAPTAAGPWTQAGTLEISLTGASELFLTFDAIGGTINVPASAPFIDTLPDDSNSGSTWVSGERAFMNNSWVAKVNSNFANLVAALQAAGIFS